MQTITKQQISLLSVMLAAAGLSACAVTIPRPLLRAIDVTATFIVDGTTDGTYTGASPKPIPGHKSQPQQTEPQISVHERNLHLSQEDIEAHQKAFGTAVAARMLANMMESCASKGGKVEEPSALAYRCVTAEREVAVSLALRGPEIVKTTEISNAAAQAPQMMQQLAAACPGSGGTVVQSRDAVQCMRGAELIASVSVAGDRVTHVVAMAASAIAAGL